MRSGQRWKGACIDDSDNGKDGDGRIEDGFME